MQQKEQYISPLSEALELRLEGNLLSGSPVFNGFGNEEELEG